jgi:hypothetical protein
MKEGTVPIPPGSPSACAIVLYNLLRSYRMWEEPGGGGETPIERFFVFSNISHEN